MKKTLKQFGTATLLMLSMCGTKMAFAGERGGNGGDVIVCPEGIYMLDSVESSRRKQPVSIQTSDETLRAKLDLLLGRVKNKDENIFKEIKSRAEVLYKDIIEYEETGELEQLNISFTDGELVNVADEGATYIPSGCKIEQLIIQSTKPMPGDKKFLFQKDLWGKMDLNEKSVAIMHESIYGYLLDNGINNSQSTRFFNGLIISGQLEKTQDKNYFQIISEIGFPQKEIRKFGFIFELKDFHDKTIDNLYYNSDGSISKIRFAKFETEFNFIKGTKFSASYAEDIEIKSLRWVNLRLPFRWVISSIFNADSMEELKATYELGSFGPLTVRACNIQNVSALEGPIITSKSFSGLYEWLQTNILTIDSYSMNLIKLKSGYKLTGLTQVYFKKSVSLASLRNCTHKISFKDVSLNLSEDFSITSVNQVD